MCEITCISASAVEMNVSRFRLVLLSSTQVTSKIAIFYSLVVKVRNPLFHAGGCLYLHIDSTTVSKWFKNKWQNNYLTWFFMFTKHECGRRKTRQHQSNISKCTNWSVWLVSASVLSAFLSLECGALGNDSLLSASSFSLQISLLDFTAFEGKAIFSRLLTYFAKTNIPCPSKPITKVLETFLNSHVRNLKIRIFEKQLLSE